MVLISIRPRRFLVSFASLAILLAAGLDTGAARAQDSTSTEKKPGHALCWKGKPECGSFVLTEMGVLYRFDEYPFEGDDSRVVVTFDLGWMKNLDKRRAVGVTGYALVNDDISRFGIRPRYRRWLSKGTSLDISPGIILGGEDPAMTYDPPGFVLGATANASDLIAVTIETEYSRFSTFDLTTGESGSRSDWTVRGGAKLGSGLGVAGTVAWFAILVAAIASTLGSD